MVIIWLMMVNNYLVGGAISPSWKMMDFVNGFRMKSHIWHGKEKMFETTNQKWVVIFQHANLFDDRKQRNCDGGSTLNFSAEFFERVRSNSNRYETPNFSKNFSDTIKRKWLI